MGLKYFDLSYPSGASAFFTVHQYKHCSGKNPLWESSMRVRSAVDEPPQVVVHGGEYRQCDGHPCGTENQESAKKILKKKKSPVHYL